MRRRICGALLGGLSQGKMSGWSAGVWVVGTVEAGSVSGDGSIGDAGVVEGVGEGMEAGVEAGVLLGVADGPVEERLSKVWMMVQLKGNWLVWARQVVVCFGEALTSRES